jgi:hypothetical protein
MVSFPVRLSNVLHQLRVCAAPCVDLCDTTSMYRDSAYVGELRDYFKLEGVVMTLVTSMVVVSNRLVQGRIPR